MLDDEPLTLPQAQQLARELLRTGGFVLSSHASKRLEERGLTTGDCMNVIRAGQCTEYNYENGSYRYRFETPRGYCVMVAFQSESELCVVTAWKKE